MMLGLLQNPVAYRKSLENIYHSCKVSGMEPTTPRLMNLAEVAKRYGLAPRTIRNAARSGELVAFQPGTRIMYTTESEAEAWIQRKRVTPIHPKRVSKKAANLKLAKPPD